MWPRMLNEISSDLPFIFFSLSFTLLFPLFHFLLIISEWEDMQQPTDSSQSMLLTLHDAITDSPVYRSSTLHFDEQLDLLEKWLELLSKYMKQYVDKLNSEWFRRCCRVIKIAHPYCLLEFNLETNILCKKVIPVGIDDSMIGNITFWRANCD